MGLQKTILLPTGIEVVDAYFRITHTIIEWEDLLANINVAVYKSKTDADNGVRPIKTSPFTLKDEDVNTWFGETVIEAGSTTIRKQAYEWLKTQDYFSDAVDVLET